MVHFKLLLQLHHQETELLIVIKNSIYDKEKIRKTVQEVKCHTHNSNVSCNNIK